MTRTTAVPEVSDSMLSGATILPGVPLPQWGRPAEPVIPDPPPAPPAPHAEAAAPLHTEVEAAAPLVPPVEAPPAMAEAEVHQPRSHRREVASAASVATAAVLTADADTVADALDAPVPQLAPPMPVPPRAEVYAAAGAAPPTAPWGTPPADPAEVAPLEPVEPVEPVYSFSAEVAQADVDHEVAQVGSDDRDGDARPERPRRALLALGAVGAALVLGAVAAFVWPGFLVADDQASAPTPRPAVSVATKVTLAAPDSIRGLTSISGAPAATLAKAAAGTTLPGYTAPVTAVYGTGTTPSATVVAWNATTRGTIADVSAAFAGFQSATGQPVSGIAPVSTGKLGGRMSCGSGVVGTTPASVCFWGDDATFGTVTVLRPTDASTGAATAVAIRQAMETRS